MQKKHWNTGNKHALKYSSDEAATSYIHARCLTSDKSRWVKKAQSENLKLTEWIVKTLNNGLIDSD